MSAAAQGGSRCAGARRSARGQRAAVAAVGVATGGPGRGTERGAAGSRQQAAPPLCERLASPSHQGRGRAIAAPRRASLLRLTAVRNAPAQARSLCFAADGTAAVPLRPRSSERRLAPLQSQERPLAGTRRRSSMASVCEGLGTGGVQGGAPAGRARERGNSSRGEKGAYGKGGRAGWSSPDR